MKQLSIPLKVAIVSVSLGVSVISLLAAYLNRRRSRAYQDIDSFSEKESLKNLNNTVKSRNNNSTLVTAVDPLTRQSNSPHNVSRVRKESSTFSCSAAESAGSEAGTVTLSNTNNVDVSGMSAEQLCELGMDNLQNSIALWEEAMEKLVNSDDSTVTAASEQLSQQISQLLERSYKMRDFFAGSVFRQISTAVAIDSAIEAITDLDLREERLHRHSMLDDDSSDDQDSFVSALDFANLSDLEDHKDVFRHLALYEEALEEIQLGRVHCRTLRTRLLDCLSDTEFLAKLYCVRAAFSTIFSEEKNKSWFADVGKEFISKILVKAEKDAEEFRLSFDRMLSYVNDSSNAPEIDEELSGRGVRFLSFYDIVIDFILFDSFDDLDNPPNSVKTVLNNRWLSNRFKETALSTAVWSVLKAKRKMLKFPNGFISKFYSISEHVSPVLAWGFLGPSTHITSLCEFFKSEILGFMQDVFSFVKVRYTTVDQLAEDIMNLAQERYKVSSTVFDSTP